MKFSTIFVYYPVQPRFNQLNHDPVIPVQSTAWFLKHWFCHKQRRGKNWMNRIIYLLQSVLVFVGIQKTKTPEKSKKKRVFLGFCCAITVVAGLAAIYAFFLLCFGCNSGRTCSPKTPCNGHLHSADAPLHSCMPQLRLLLAT